MSESHSFDDVMRRSATPRFVRWMARLVVVLFLATPFLLAFVPWQQTVQGRGQVVAYSPVERMQVLTARVSGQVRKWHVVEGSRVKMNDPVVDIEDNDPELAARLEAQREFLAGRLAALGVEPRLLMAWRLAAEREADVFEPIVKAAQNSGGGDRRDDAMKLLDDLVGLGEELRTALLRNVTKGLRSGS